jgi:hypothetical protein
MHCGPKYGIVPWKIFTQLFMQRTIQMKVGKGSACTELIKGYAVKTYGGNGCINPRFNDLGGQCSASYSGPFTLGERAPILIG